MENVDWAFAMHQVAFQEFYTNDVITDRQQIDNSSAADTPVAYQTTHSFLVFSAHL